MTFLLLVHTGRKTGQSYSTVAMILSRDPQSHEAVICSAWGKDSDWIRNIQAHPAVKVQIGTPAAAPAISSSLRFMVLAPGETVW